jgi:hypothetical protein
MENCPSATGTDYPNQISFVDSGDTAPGPWIAGQYNTTTDGACVGLVIDSWTSRKIVYTFGSNYGATNDGEWALHDGDIFVVSVKGYLAVSSVPSGF